MPLTPIRIKQLARSGRNLINPKKYIWELYKIVYKDQPFIIKMRNGLKIRVYSNDIIGEQIYTNGVFEPREVAFVTKFLKPGMVFFDIGANLGQYTLLGAVSVGKKGCVHSFEPSVRMFSELEYNVKLNSLSKTCVLNRLAVADTNSIRQLSTYEAGAEVYGSLGNQHWSGKKIIGYEDVETIKIDDYFQKNGIPRVDLIKMDIEGAELLALKGCEQLLSQPNGPTIILEVADINTVGFGYSPYEIWDYLGQFGYTLNILNKTGSMAGVVDKSYDFSQGVNLVGVKN